MKLDDLYEYYQKSWVNVMRQTGVGSTSLLNWRKLGYIPIVSQLKIETNTNGLFQANLEHTKQD